MQLQNPEARNEARTRRSCHEFLNPGGADFGAIEFCKCAGIEVDSQSLPCGVALGANCVRQITGDLRKGPPHFVLVGTGSCSASTIALYS